MGVYIHKVLAAGKYWGGEGAQSEMRWTRIDRVKSAGSLTSWEDRLPYRDAVLLRNMFSALSLLLTWHPKSMSTKSNEPK